LDSFFTVFERMQLMMKKYFLLTLLLLSAILVTGQDKTLVWSDEFNGATINSTYWDYDLGNGEGGWGNQELQYYTDRTENARVEGGNLILTAKKESYAGFNYTSARLVTRNKVAWKYGRIEVRANLPEGTGIWPAIWMLPEVWNYGNGSWPDNGEIDIMEYVGYQPDVVHASLHNHNRNAGNSITKTLNLADAEENFHVYALEWTEDKIEMFVDDTKFFTYNNPQTGWQDWPWDKEFHLLINIAVGGTWGGAQGVDDAIFPQTMEIDYVRVYQLASTQEMLLESAETATTHNEINLDFNLELATPQDEESSFEVVVNNTEIYQVDSVYIDAANPKRLKIRTETPFQRGDVISLSYTPGNIQSTSGVILQAFEGKLVDNNIGTSTTQLEDMGVKIYPNPFTEQLIVEDNLQRIASLQVFSSDGKLVYRQSTLTHPRINTANWATGLYVVKIYYRNSTMQSAKILKLTP
jgi:beta-glucanase (GH16 family)